MNLGERLQTGPVASIVHTYITRDGYTERTQAEFPATYGRMGNRQTDLQLGMDVKYVLNNSLSLDGGLGTNIKLASQQDAFSGKIDYIGAYTYSKGKMNAIRPYSYVGINVTPTNSSVFRVQLGWQQTDYRGDAAQVGISYSYRF